MRVARLGPALAAIALILAAFLRFYALGSNPPGVWQDEASTAVDAYHLWHTGADRAGDRWPIISRSFGDYPFATYRYLTAPVVGLFGIGPGPERFWAATLSLTLVLALVLLMRRAFGPASALGAALSAAICPTWIHLARYGSEQILLPTTLMLALLMFDLGRDPGRRGWLWGGALALAASAYSYHAAKVLVPLWSIGLLVYLWPTARALWSSGERRHVLGPILLVLLLVAPSIYLATTPEGGARGQDAAAFTRLGGRELLVHVAEMYGHFWHPGRLFFAGPATVILQPPGLGMWSWLDLPLIALGLGAVAIGLRGHPRRRLAVFWLFWLLIGPLPGAIGYEPESITRLIGWLPAPAALAGLGFGWVVASQRLARARPVVLAALVTLWVASAARVVDRILVEYPRIAQRQWQYEISAAMRCARDHALAAPVQPQVVVSRDFAYHNTFSLFWFLALPPLPDGRDPFVLGERRRVADGELYVMPRTAPQPDGVLLCTIAIDGEALSFVYGPAQPGLPAAW